MRAITLLIMRPRTIWYSLMQQGRAVNTLPLGQKFWHYYMS